MLEVLLGILVFLMIICSYGLGRNHEVMWWLRLSQVILNKQIARYNDGEISEERSQGNVETHEELIDALEEREKTWRGRWLAP